MDNTWWRSANELDEDQRELINIQRDGKYLVLGPAGSGKTNILVLRASYLYNSGLRNILVLSFTRVLSEFLSIGHGNYSVPQERVSTFAKWSSKFIEHAGRRDDKQEDEGDAFDRFRRANVEKMLEIISSGAYGQDHFDAVLIDEVQDYWKEEINVISSLTRRLFLVGDSKQRIYGRNEGIEAARYLGCDEHRLQHHYRVGRHICTVADQILSDATGLGLEADALYNEVDHRSSVEVIKRTTLDEQARELLAKLAVQVRAYPGEWIGVLCPKRALRDAVWAHIANSELSDLAQLQSGDAGYEEFGPGKVIHVMTVHAAKGLEFRAVHLPAAESFSIFPREVAFTAVTRAKTSLTVYHSGPLPGFLDAAVHQRPTRPPDIVELFK